MAMAKRADKKPFLATYNKEKELARFADVLAKPAYGLLTDMRGYEDTLWGGQQAWLLGRNLQKTYQNMVLDYAVKAEKYTPSKVGMGVDAQVTEARSLGLVPGDMRPMTPPHWRAVLANLPLTSTEGGIGLSMKGMISLLSGLSDLATGRRTKEGKPTTDFQHLTFHLRRLADISPNYVQFLPDATSKEASAAASASAFAELNEAYATFSAAV